MIGKNLFKKDYDAGKDAKKDFKDFQKLAHKEVKECLDYPKKKRSMY